MHLRVSGLYSALLSLAFCLLPLSFAAAETANIAVAANFTGAAKDLQIVFEEKTEHKLQFSFGSTGKLTTQILHGAPFVAFFAADMTHPQKLIDEGFAASEKVTAYASGGLALFSTNPDLIDPDGDILRRPDTFKHLAIANPISAPYGLAAKEVMEKMGIWSNLQPKIVQGGNISQTYQFVMTGNAELGFIAKSQIAKGFVGSAWQVPPTLHAPLQQGAILLKKGTDNKAAIAFFDFLNTAEARDIIIQNGYVVEDAN